MICLQLDPYEMQHEKIQMRGGGLDLCYALSIFIELMF